MDRAYGAQIPDLQENAKIDQSSKEIWDYMKGIIQETYRYGTCEGRLRVHLAGFVNVDV
ncbi:MAG: hypothetical protein ACLR2O_09015 [Coprococcus sp.]